MKNGYKSVKTALLLSNVIDADHQNSYLFINEVADVVRAFVLVVWVAPAWVRTL